MRSIISVDATIISLFILFPWHIIGPSVALTYKLELYRDSTPLLGTYDKTNKDSTLPEASSPYTYVSPLPSLDILEFARCH
jgi:hypothetical protein